MPVVHSKFDRTPVEPALSRNQQRQLAAASVVAPPPSDWLPNSVAHFPASDYILIVDDDDSDAVIPFEECTMQQLGIASDAMPAMPPVREGGLSVNAFSVGVVARDATLTPEQQAQIDSLKSEFSDILSSSAGDIGVIPDELNITHRIVTGDAAPVAQRPYKIASYSEEAWLKEHIQMLLKLGVISPSSSCWMSPIVLVKKKTGDLRLCIDFRKLNAVTQNDPYPVPRIESIMRNMAGCKFFSSLDLRSGYWHIKLHPDDAHKTGFTTPFGNFQFNRTPFGLISAGASFQRVADAITQDLENTEAYVDDTFVFSQTWDQHMSQLRALLTRMREYGLKLNLDKCTFGAPTMQCLGYVVGQHGISVDPDKVSAVLKLPVPQTASDIKSFLGMCSYYRSFIPEFAKLASPMQLLLRKGTTFIWSDECESSFQQLKLALTSANVLRLPDWDREFMLTTDFSAIAIGAVLSQTDASTGLEYPVAYASRVLTPAESRYAATEGEMLALVWGVEKFRYYLYGRQFTVHTDHHSLQWLGTARFHNSKVERWALKLQEFRFEVKYKKGTDNAVADHLSRSVSVSMAKLLCADATKDAPADMPQVARPCLVAATAATIWPATAERQADLDNVACTVCHDAGGWDNLVICDTCQRCFHLRCLTPPACSVPSGEWHCPACKPLRNLSAEMYMPDTPLRYSPTDVHLDTALLEYVYRQRLPDKVEEARRVKRTAEAICIQRAEPHWPLISYKLRGQNAQWLLCPPVEYRWDFIRMFHCDLLAHSGIEQTLAAMHQHVHWPGIKSDIASYLKCCDPCQRHKLLLPSVPPMQQPSIYGPFRHLHVDLAGPFVASIVPDLVATSLASPRSHAKAYIVIMVDYFTKVAELAVIYDKQSATVARAVWNAWLCRYGLPDYITSDNGQEFAGDFKHMLANQGIAHIHTTPYHPAANGAAERLVRSVKSMLIRYVNGHPAHWIQSLPNIRLAYMTRLHTALGLTPNHMIMGFTPKPPTLLTTLFDKPSNRSHPVLIANATVHLRGGEPVYIDQSQSHEMYMQYASDLAIFMDHVDGIAYQSLRRHTTRSGKRWLRRAWKARRKDITIGVGDLVLELVESPSGPLQHHVKGPFKVTGFTSSSKHVAVLETGATGFKDAQLYTRHINRLARYYTINQLQPPQLGQASAS